MTDADQDQHGELRDLSRYLDPRQYAADLVNQTNGLPVLRVHNRSAPQLHDEVVSLEGWYVMTSIGHRLAAVGNPQLAAAKLTRILHASGQG